MRAEQQRVAIGGLGEEIARRPDPGGWPSASLSLLAIKRAGISVGPPAPKPTRSRMVLFG
jgi:hypothetical protein